MTSNLDEFLGLDDVSEIREEISVKVGDKTLNMVIRPVTQEEHLSFQKRCNVFKGKTMTFDTGKYNNLILSNCIVEPNFNDVKFLEKAKCADAIDFLNKKFSSGALATIAEKIQKLSGFQSYEVEIESAKN